MAVAFDAKMTGGNGDTGRCQQATAATSISSTGMTVGASATLLVAVLCFGATSGSLPTSISMTWAGQAMTAGPIGTHGAGSYAAAAVFYKINPVTGNQTLSASWTNSNDCYMSCASFTGTDVSTGINTTDNATASATHSINVTSDSTGATVAAFGCNGADPTVTQTEIFSTAPLNPGGGASYAIGGTTNTHTFTEASSSFQALAGVHVLAAASGFDATTMLGGIFNEMYQGGMVGRIYV